MRITWIVAAILIMSAACTADTMINRVDLWKDTKPSITTLLFYDNGMEVLMYNWNKEGRDIEVGKIVPVSGAKGLRAGGYIAFLPGTKALYVEPAIQYGCPIGRTACHFDTILARYISLSEDTDYWSLVIASIITPVTKSTKAGIMLTGSKTDGQPASGSAGPVVVVKAGSATVRAEYRCVPVGTDRSSQLRLQVATPF